MINVAINGFGRIGRNILRALYEGEYRDKITVVAINDLSPADSNLHLLQYDSTHGRFNANLSGTEDAILVNGDEIQMFSQREPDQLPWQELKVDIVFECTGFFRTPSLASKHLQAGAKKVLLSAPGKNEADRNWDATVVYGVNEDILTSDLTLVSNASCTTNCLAHVAKAMHDFVGINEGFANTVHAYTSTQNLVDRYHKDKRRARAAAYSVIPTSTGSAKAIGEVIPDLAGKLDAVAVRTPIINVSLLDFTFTPERSATEREIRQCFTDYASARKGIVEINNEPLVSIDFNHNPASCIVDLGQLFVKPGLVKILAWYDNEWGYSNRMLDTALSM